MSRKANHQLLYLAAPALLLLLFGCSNSLHEREAVNAFASNYIEFHKAVYDSEISMWVIALDVSGQVGDPSTTAYRQDFVKAFAAHLTNAERAENARQAVAAYDSNSMKLFDEFDAQNSLCDSKSLALVDAASAITDGDYRKQAVSLAGTAREISSTLAETRNNYSEIYGLQVNLANELASNNGDMRSILTLMKLKVPEQNSLLDETARLRDQEQKSVRAMETQYAEIKGMTGITVDYQPPR